MEREEDVQVSRNVERDEDMVGRDESYPERRVIACRAGERFGLSGRTRACLILELCARLQRTVIYVEGSCSQLHDTDLKLCNCWTKRLPIVGFSYMCGYHHPRFPISARSRTCARTP